MDMMAGSVNQKRLDWLDRLQIAEDAAKGLVFKFSFVGALVFTQQPSLFVVFVVKHLQKEYSFNSGLCLTG